MKTTTNHRGTKLIGGSKAKKQAQIKASKIKLGKKAKMAKFSPNDGFFYKN